MTRHSGTTVGTNAPHGENEPASAASDAYAGGYTDRAENAQNRTEVIMALEALGMNARDHGERSLACDSNDTPDLGLGPSSNPLGDVEAEAESGVNHFDGNEPPMRVDVILKKWEADSIGQDYSDGTKRRYQRDFQRFAEDIQLETHNRKWLSVHGRKAIIEWVMALPEKSRASVLAGVESVWTFGVPAVSWPITKKRDFGRKVFPQAGQRSCPENTDVEPIFRAAQREDDPYLRSLVLTALSEGGRPGNQLAQFQWADIREFGSVLAIVAESKPGRKFKTSSPVIARLPSIASEALKVWKAKTPFNAPEDYVWPRRAHGKLSRLMGDDHSMAKEWKRFLARHQIATWVTMAHLRHWIEYRAEQDGVSRVILAYVRGHSVKAATEGALGYSGNRKVPKVLEDEGIKWPEGACGFFTASEVKVVDELAPYMATIAEYGKGKMTTDEVSRRLESIRLGILKQNPDIVP
jgi:hypothetical protein